METTTFDTITRTVSSSMTRRSAVRGLFTGAVAAAVGTGILLQSEDTAARKKGKGKKGKKGTGSSGGSTGGGGTGGSRRADRCGGPVGICNADPTPCGTTASGEVCGCERAVEGNNVCVNSGADNVCASAVECTSTDGKEATSCRSQVGFHFFCQEAKQAGAQFCGCGFGTTTGRVCVPECDNPNPL